MALDVGDIVATLRANTDGFSSQFKSALNDAQKSADGFQKNLNSELSNAGNPLSGVEEKVGKIKSVLSGAAISGIGLGLTNYITMPLIDMAKAAVETADEFTKARMAFTTMLGTQAAADKFLKTLQDIAVTTPFEFTQLQDASKRLLAMGIEAGKIPDMILKIGDAVAGLGSGTMGFNRITLALGQMQAKGRVTAEEMRQFTEAGIGAWDSLAKHLNITVAEAMDRVTKKQVDSATGITAILGGMGEKFGGLMQQQSNTIEGTLSNLRDTATLMMAQIGKEIIETLKLPEALKTVGEFARQFLDWFKQLDSGTKTFALTFVAAMTAGGPILVAVGAFMAALAAGMGPIMAGGAIIAGVIAGVTAIIVNWESIKAKGIAIWTAVRDGVVGTVIGIYEGIKKWMVDKLNAILEPIRGFADSVVGIFTRLKDILVTHSIVPDMVEEIGDHMRMLDKNMVAPSRAAARGTWQTFRELAGQMSETASTISNTMLSTFNSVTSSLSNAMATQIIQGNDWKKTMESVAISALAAMINLGAQLVVQYAAQEVVYAATMASHSAVSLAAATAEVGIMETKNATILAGEAATGSGVVAIWTSVSGAVVGAFGAMTGAIATFFTGTIIPMFAAVGEVVIGFLSSIAGALDISIFGAPFSIPVWAAVGLVAAAVGVISAFAFGAFAEGGIITRPTMALMGEAGPEAVIPLSKLGQMNGGGQTTVVIELDGRTIARSVFDNMPSVMRVRGVSA